MKKKNESNVVLLLEQFQKNILGNKPSIDQMIKEVQMMRFKIRPIQGDFSYLNFQNSRFIEILWSLGKMDEFFNRRPSSLSSKQKGIFFNYFDSMYRSFQDELNKLNLKLPRTGKNPSVFEMEIFKEKKPNKKVN
ncbi:hypothetical protein COY87_04055 [Candidatus Roizmanbacteria bacterium CG_4_10_14_0_8_um_filter_33_9]|uniref:Uncharacterized protein n=1 Tax=Candidatus Roizmanbacteria bacterium CG_4_10_14_0_8_um_filter_33_9 TaxID=1974826 RepID=A0A2M7QHN4_9BACT|nr:MAG: hypothetical protein COY87_04055 [Candidatus Roizmanbacteria bacterium CG_4_10_14_0_8_um_filter_33_9]